MVDPLSYSLALLAVVFYLLNYLDLRQTLMAIRLGAKEANPLLSGLHSKNKEERERTALNATFFKHIIGILLLILLPAVKIEIEKMMLYMVIGVTILTVVVVGNQVEEEEAFSAKIRRIKRRCRK